MVSWSRDPAGCEQRAYEIVVHDHDTGADATTAARSSPPSSVLVPWPFDPLASAGAPACSGAGDRRSTGDGSDWSDPLDIEVGLLDPSDWTAVPITATFPDARARTADPLPAHVRVRQGLVRARLYASALGVYTVECNGRPIGDDVLAPGWTSYHHRLRYQTFDVTDAAPRRRRTRWA